MCPSDSELQKSEQHAFPALRLDESPLARFSSVAVLKPAWEPTTLVLTLQRKPSHPSSCSLRRRSSNSSKPAGLAVSASCRRLRSGLQLTASGRLRLQLAQGAPIGLGCWIISIQLIPHLHEGVRKPEAAWNNMLHCSQKLARC